MILMNFGLGVNSQQHHGQSLKLTCTNTRSSRNILFEAMANEQLGHVLCDEVHVSCDTLKRSPDLVDPSG